MLSNEGFRPLHFSEVSHNNPSSSLFFSSSFSSTLSSHTPSFSYTHPSLVPYSLIIHHPSLVHASVSSTLSSYTPSFSSTLSPPELSFSFTQPSHKYPIRLFFPDCPSPIHILLQYPILLYVYPIRLSFPDYPSPIHHPSLVPYPLLHHSSPVPILLLYLFFYPSSVPILLLYLSFSCTYPSILLLYLSFFCTYPSILLLYLSLSYYISFYPSPEPILLFFFCTYPSILLQYQSFYPFRCTYVYPELEEHEPPHILSLHHFLECPGHKLLKPPKFNYFINNKSIFTQFQGCIFRPGAIHEDLQI